MTLWDKQWSEILQFGIKQNPKYVTSVDKKRKNWIIFNRLSVIQNQHRPLVVGHLVDVTSLERKLVQEKWAPLQFLTIPYKSRRSVWGGETYRVWSKNILTPSDPVIITHNAVHQTFIYQEVWIKSARQQRKYTRISHSQPFEPRRQISGINHQDQLNYQLLFIESKQIHVHKSLSYF